MPGPRGGPDGRESGGQRATREVDDLPIGMRFDQPGLWRRFGSLMLCGLVNPLKV
jgi:hypothetical protein